MLHLIFAGAGLMAWVLPIIFIYYSTYYSKINHIESATGFTSYLFFMILIYVIYKIYMIFMSERKEFQIGLGTIISLILGHILILCGFYSSLPEVIGSPFMSDENPGTLVLFFHILSLLIYPLLLVILSRSSGFSIMNILPIDWKNEDMRIRFIVETSLGFLLLSSILLVLSWIFGFTLTIVIVTLVITAIIGLPGLIETCHDIKNRSINIVNHNIHGTFIESLNPKLLTMEFSFFFLTLLFGISLINALRPMPIGWDDLGVYMNFPKIMAMSGEILQGAGLYVWQLLTATGFLFSHTAAQAFYINQLGGLLAVIAIICSVSYILEENGKKSLIAFPILFAAIYYAMPMTVFQQAKDMKLDPALLFFSISAFSLHYALWKSERSIKSIFILIFISGLLIGFTFGVKLTSLMLLLGGLGLIAYKQLGFGGYIGFFGFFIAIFTHLNLWTRLNVNIIASDTIIHGIVIGGVLMAIGGVISSYLFGSKSFKFIRNWIIGSLVLLLGFGVALTPWIVKNYTETKILSINSFLWGSGGTTSYDYKQFNTPEELKDIEMVINGGINENGQSKNEDLDRYFGYDEGINGYLKMPAHLTFQKNQAGEFTELSYIFLAFVFGSLLFIGSKKYIFSYFAAALLIFLALYYFTPATSELITGFFDTITLNNTVGYGVLLAINFIFLSIAHFTFEKTEANKKLLDILMFMGVYGFIFLISAFGIVWYGIMIYFGFFLIIGLALSIPSTYTEEDEKNENLISIKLTLSAIIFICISAYFIKSVFPHGWNNLKQAYYNEYKYNILTQDEAIFAYRSDYVTPIATLNLNNPDTLIKKLLTLDLSPEIKKLLETNKDVLTIDAVHSIIMKLRSQGKSELTRDAKILGDTFYSTILYPNDAESNTGGIYRIGTFMTYLIDNNRKRYFDDSLVMIFSNYIYTDSPEETVERMKKMGLKYLLIDLNAATIDKDPRHDLTNRFERLLLTMRAKNLRLVDTDNTCIELALDEYRKGRLQDPTSYIDIAGTNYESYRSGATIPRNQKLYNCHQYIVNKLNSGDELTPSLQQLNQAIISNGAQNSPEKLSQILSSYAGQSWFALFEITDIPAEISIPAVSNTGTTNTGITAQ